MTNKNGLSIGVVITLCILTLLIGVFNGAMVFPAEKVVVTEKLVEANCSNVTIPEFVLTESDFELKSEEAMAEILFLESFDSRDFEKAVFDALVDFGVDIESYKDITEIKYDFTVDGDEIEVENLKVYYFIDGDEDETEKALLEDFTVEIDNLDFDELSDAEVNENYLDNLTVDKVYN